MQRLILLQLLLNIRQSTVLPCHGVGLALLLNMHAGLYTSWQWHLPTMQARALPGSWRAAGVQIQHRHMMQVWRATAFSSTVRRASLQLGSSQFPRQAPTASPAASHQEAPSSQWQQQLKQQQVHEEAPTSLSKQLYQHLEQHQEQLQHLPISWRTLPGLPQAFFTATVQEGMLTQVRNLQEEYRLRQEYFLVTEAEKLLAPSKFYELQDWVVLECIQQCQLSQKALDEAARSCAEGSQELEQAQQEYEEAQHVLQCAHHDFHTFALKVHAYHQAQTSRGQFRRSQDFFQPYGME